LMMGSEGSIRGIQTKEWLEYFCLMDHFLVRLEFLLIIVRSSFILVCTEKMVSVRISISFFHIVCCNVLHASFHIAIIVSSLINLIIKLFEMLKLRVFPIFYHLYTNFCLPPAKKALLWTERSCFYFWYSWFSLNLSL
jgi:hypothetical protein